MPAQLRSNKEAMKIAYDLLKTPKNLQQDNKTKPDPKVVAQWEKEGPATR